MAASFFNHIKYCKSFVWKNNTTLNLGLVILCYIRHEDVSKTEGDPLIDHLMYIGKSVIFTKRMPENMF